MALVLEDSSFPARRHIHEIRTHKFSIGRKDRNPLTNDLHHAVLSLSRELYTKDVHFLMELIQNAEDNEYGAGVEPTLELVLTDEDLTHSGSSATLLVFNNEIGFTRENMDSICSIGLSTKKGKGNQGYIGEKGIGFKSVFLVSKRPHIFSNGYQVRFQEEPDKDCGIGFIVPEWADSHPSLFDVLKVYGLEQELPTTTIILPLRGEKIEPVRKLLSEVHPEILLFMSKIKRLSVRQSNSSSCQLSAISISSETKLPPARNANEDTHLVLLSVEEESPQVAEATCKYFIWKNAFPVKPDNRIDERKDIDNWEISIAFPFGKRLDRGTSSVGIFSFMPTAMVTNFRFIVQADFILSTSRETILLDNKWNSGILECVPSAFVSAFISYIRADAISSPLFSHAMKFLPIQLSPVPEFNSISRSIRALLQENETVPCALFCDESTVFHKPCHVTRVFPDFRAILVKMKGEGVPLADISTLGNNFLHSSLDLEKYDKVLNFLGVLSVDKDYSWYSKCIKFSNLLSRASASVYVELLFFLARKWKLLPSRSVKSVSLLKYVTRNREIASCSIGDIKQHKLMIYCFWNIDQHEWLGKWNLEFGCPGDTFFLPDSVMTLLLNRKDSFLVRSWLANNNFVVLPKMADYFCALSRILRGKMDQKLVISFAHLLFHAYSKKLIAEDDLYKICRFIPIVDASGKVTAGWTKSLVPSIGSKWIKMFSSHKSFSGMEEKTTLASFAASQSEEYVEIGDVYAKSAQQCGEFTPENELLLFIMKYTRAIDLPDILPPNVMLQEASAELRSDQALVLLDWIRSLRSKNFSMPLKFIESIQNGRWMKTCSGFNSPNKCFLWNNTDISADLKIKDISRILPVIDQDFYMNSIGMYREELIYIGVRMSLDDAYKFISGRLISLALSGMSKEYLHLLLKLMKCSRVRFNLFNESLMSTVKGGKWMKTNMGYTTPVGSVFLSSESTIISQITCLPIIDQSYYGNWIANYVSELELLGVVVGLEGARKLVVDNLKLPADLLSLSRESILFILGCIKRLGSAAAGLAQKIMVQPLMRTSLGLKCPSEAILSDQEWSHFLPVLSVPIIDEAFYGSEIRSFTAELKEIGVAVDLDMATELISVRVKSLASSYMLMSEDVVALLKCIKYVRGKEPDLCRKFILKIAGENWLKTRQGYRNAWSAVLSDMKWKTLSQVANLPLIDDTYYGHVIYDFREELKLMKVIVDVRDGAPLVACGLKLPKDPSVGSLGIDGRALLLRGRTQKVGEIHLGKSRGDALRGEDVRLNKEESKTSCVGKPSSRQSSARVTELVKDEVKQRVSMRSR